MRPAEEMPLETKILEPLEREGRLGGLYRASLSGMADKLSQAAKTLRRNFLFAIVMTYLGCHLAMTTLPSRTRTGTSERLSPAQGPETQ